MRQAAMAAAYVYYRGYYFTRGYLAYPLMSHNPTLYRTIRTDSGEPVLFLLPGSRMEA